MKYTEIQEKSREELEKLLKDKKMELFEMKLKLKTMQLTNPNEIRACRKDIARIKTAISAQKNA